MKKIILIVSIMLIGLGGFSQPGGGSSKYSKNGPSEYRSEEKPQHDYYCPCKHCRDSKLNTPGAPIDGYIPAMLVFGAAFGAYYIARRRDKVA